MNFIINFQIPNQSSWNWIQTRIISNKAWGWFKNFKRKNIRRMGYYNSWKPEKVHKRSRTIKIFEIQTLKRISSISNKLGWKFKKSLRSFKRNWIIRTKKGIRRCSKENKTKRRKRTLIKNINAKYNNNK